MWELRGGFLFWVEGVLAVGWVFWVGIGWWEIFRARVQACGGGVVGCYMIFIKLCHHRNTLGNV